MRLSLITTSLILALFTFVVVAGFSLSRTGPRKLSARLLAGFLLALAASLANFLYVTSGMAAQDPRFAFLGNSLGLAAAPLLYLYACSLAVEGFRLRASTALHFAPVLGVLGVVVAAYSLQPEPVQRAILHDAQYPSALNSKLLQAAIFLYVFFYLLACVRVLLRHRALYRQQQAATGLAELGWLRISLAGTLLLAVVEVLHQLLVGRWPGSMPGSSSSRQSPRSCSASTSWSRPCASPRTPLHRSACLAPARTSTDRIACPMPNCTRTPPASKPISRRVAPICKARSRSATSRTGCRSRRATFRRL